MNCKICFVAYDHSKHKPLSLSCPHTFCQECLNHLASNTCPNCNETIKAKYPNLALLELIPESKYDQLKSKLEKALVSSSELCNKFLIERDQIYTQNFRQLHHIKEEINVKANELIASIKQQQFKLLNELVEYELKLNETYDQLRDKLLVDEFLKQTKKDLNSNNLNENEMAKMIEQIDFFVKSVLSMHGELEYNLNENYQFVLNKQINVDNFMFAELRSNEKLSKELVRKGLEHYAAKNYSEAISTADKALQVKSKCATAMNLKGLALKDLKKYKQAAECFNQAIDIESTNHIYYLNKGCALSGMKEWSKALECFNKSIELKLDFDLAFNSKGVVLNELKQYKQAVECFNKAIEFDSKKSTYYFNLAETLKNQREFKSSLEVVNKAIELNSSHALSYNLKGLVLIELKDYKNAVLMFGKACEIDSHNAKFLANKASAIKICESVEPIVKKRKFT